MSEQINHSYEFGAFRLIPAERQLLRDGKPVTLPPKAFDTLVILVEHNGHVVKKDHLLKTVWPDAFVEENNLNQYVSLLRKTLRNGNNGDRYIETVRRYGYRFTADLRELDGETNGLLVHKHTRTQVIVKEEQHEYQRRLVLEQPAVQEVKERLGRRIARIGMLALVMALASWALGAFFLGPRSEVRNAPPISRINSLAVLPFKSLGGGNDDAYLGLGFTDVIITRLSHVRQPIIRPTSAVLKYSGLVQDPLAAGRDLNVDAVLGGRIQRSDGRMRITVELLRVKDGAPLWRDEFDGNSKDIFTLQDAISQRVARAVAPSLTGEEIARLGKHETENAEAYQSYLKGRYFWNKRTEEDFRKAIGFFQQAIKADPNYALAYAGLADCYVFLDEATEAAASAEKALQIDEQLAEAHASLGNLKLFHDYDWPGAEMEFKRSLELNPNYATAHHWYAYYLAATGRFEEALAEIKWAQEVDPLSLAINTDVGQIFYFARQYDQAVAAYQKTLDMDQSFINAHEALAATYARKGMHDEAVAELLKSGSLRGERPEVLASYKEAFAKSGWNGFWQKALDVTKERSSLIPYPVRAMEVYLELGETNQAWEGVKKNYDLRRGRMALLKVDPRYDSLRSDPRFQALLRRMKLTS